MKKFLLSLLLLTSLTIYSQALTAIALTTPTSCNGTSFGQIFVMATGGTLPYSYRILPSPTYQSNNTFTNLSAGTYTIEVKDANNNFSLTAATIEAPSPIIASAAITKPIDCVNNATITLSATGGTSPYTYSKDGFTFVQSNVFDNLVAGTYTTYVKDANGCTTSSNSITINPLSPLFATVTRTDVSCNGLNDGSITITPIGGQLPYSYSLDNGVNYVSSNVFTNLAAGTYDVIIKDASNCIVPMLTTIAQPTVLSMTAAITKPIDCISNATIALTAAGGISPYTYSINNSPYQPENYFSNLSAGAYDVIAKDSNGCITSTIVVITQPSLLTTTATVTDLNCNGSNDGSVTINATGGQTPYTYSINNLPYQPGNYFSNLTAGTYNVMVKDDNGCTASSIVVITQPNLLSTAITITDQTVTTNATGGTPPYVYSLDGTIYSTENTFSNLATGTYSSWAKDTNGCIASLDFVINAPAPLINDSNTITLSLVPGQTLADIIVEGENIKWYSTPGISTGKIKQTVKKAGETPLPLTTVLVDNTTYYASQTINGIESTERLAVTVQLNALATPDFVLTNFKSYPNPVKNNLTIQNTSTIDKVILLSITGKTVLTKTIKSLHAEIDLSNLSDGIYFLKVKSEGAEKTVKIIKE